jgi:hypothetical protein
MKNKRAFINGIAGLVLFCIITMLCLRPGLIDGPCGRIINAFCFPALFLGAALSILLWGGVESPVTYYQAVCVLYMGIVGYLLGYWLTKLFSRIKNKESG